MATIPQIPTDADGIVDYEKMVGVELVLGGSTVKITDGLAAGTAFLKAEFTVAPNDLTGKFVWLSVDDVRGETQLRYEPGVWSDGYLLNYSGVREATDEEDDAGGEYLDGWDGEIAWSLERA